MSGNERTRWCAHCELSVTDLSELHEAEAETLLERHDARVCVRAVRDSAGNVVTRTTQEARFLLALRSLAASRTAEVPP